MKVLTKLAVISGIGLAIAGASANGLKAQQNTVLEKSKKEIRKIKHDNRIALRDSLISLKDDACFFLNRTVDNYNDAKTPKQKQKTLEVMLGFYKSYLVEFNELYNEYLKQVVYFGGKKDVIAKVVLDVNVDANRIIFNVDTDEIKFKSNKYFKENFKQITGKSL